MPRLAAVVAKTLLRRAILCDVPHYEPKRMSVTKEFQKGGFTYGSRT